MIIYKCDKCEKEIPQDQVVSLVKIWKAIRYPIPSAGGKLSKVENVEEDKRILCSKCADEIWKLITK